MDFEKLNNVLDYLELKHAETSKDASNLPEVDSILDFDEFIRSPQKLVDLKSIGNESKGFKNYMKLKEALEDSKDLKMTHDLTERHTVESSDHKNNSDHKGHQVRLPFPTKKNLMKKNNFELVSSIEQRPKGHLQISEKLTYPRKSETNEALAIKEKQLKQDLIVDRIKILPSKLSKKFDSSKPEKSSENIDSKKLKEKDKAKTILQSLEEVAAKSLKVIKSDLKKENSLSSPLIYKNSDNFMKDLNFKDEKSNKIDVHIMYNNSKSLEHNKTDSSFRTDKNHIKVTDNKTKQIHNGLRK